MMARDIRVSAISYLNTAPFIYGLQNSGIAQSINISFDYPSECARKLQNSESDVGIIPVAALPSLPQYEIVSNYCIGAVGPVKTVSLLGNTPLQEIRKIYLDYQSRTSVELVKILAKNYWDIKPEWAPLSPLQDTRKLKSQEAVVIIGDRVFDAQKQFEYATDLAAEWFKYTGLPFVFAVWASVTPLEPSFLSKFNLSLELGLRNILKAVEYFSPQNISKDEAIDYLNNNISYILDEQKKKAIKLFLELIPVN